jgi:hypothetical protein
LTWKSALVAERPVAVTGTYREAWKVVGDASKREAHGVSHLEELHVVGAVHIELVALVADSQLEALNPNPPAAALCTSDCRSCIHND